MHGAVSAGEGKGGSDDEIQHFQLNGLYGVYRLSLEGFVLQVYLCSFRHYAMNNFTIFKLASKRNFSKMFFTKIWNKCCNKWCYSMLSVMRFFLSVIPSSSMDSISPRALLPRVVRKYFFWPSFSMMPSLMSFCRWNESFADSVFGR